MKIRSIAIVITLLLLIGCSKRGNSSDSAEPITLNMLGWSEYVPQEVVDGFAKETGIRVNIEAVASNEEMQSKLLAGATKYDLMQPSEYFVEGLIKMDELVPLNFGNIPNCKNILPQYVHQPFDPQSKYTVPYMSGTVGIVYNTANVKDPIKGFADVFKPEHAGRIIVVDDNREIVSWAMIVQGIPINDMTDANLERVKPMLSQWVKLIKKYDSDSPKTDLLQGNVDIGIVWNGEAAIVINQDKRYIDNLAIPKSVVHQAAAEQFINYCLRPEMSKIISEKWPYTNPNSEARKLLSSEQLNNPASYPDLHDPQTFRDIGKQSAAVDKLMTGLRNG